MARPDHIEPDPRTDGVADQGELSPLSEEEIAAGVEYDRAHRQDDQYGEAPR